METTKGEFLLRKLTVTFVSTVVLSIFFVLSVFNGGFDFEYNRGNNFMGWLFVYSMYIGIIILVYGNIVSIVGENTQRKFFPQSDWLYVFILSIFGLANGFLFQSGIAAIYGMIAAIIYGIIDKLIAERNKNGKSLKFFWITPIISLVCCWGLLEVTSPEMPPFTKEDAVIHATSGGGTIIDEFPRSIGKWEETKGDHQITREISVKEMNNGTYIVTFTEHWERNDDTNTRELSYKVDRKSVTLSSVNGDMPLFE